MENKITKNNKGFSLVELIVVIAIMAVLMGVLAPTLIGNIEKSRESKDLTNLDTVYNAVNEALSNEAVAKELSSGLAATKLSDILSGSTYPNLKAALSETLGETPDLTASCNGSSDIYVYVNANLKAKVFACADGDKASLTGVDCKKTKDSSGGFKKMEVGTAAGTTEPTTTGE